MSKLKGILLTLANDKSELRAFLADHDQWIEDRGTALNRTEREELAAIAVDLERLAEVRTIRAWGSSSEARFMSGKYIERRRFMFASMSAVLAGLLPAFCAHDVLAGAGGSRGGPSVPANGVDDNRCVNQVQCNDAGNCLDTHCENSNICEDAGGCEDNNCENAECKDTDWTTPHAIMGTARTCAVVITFLAQTSTAPIVRAWTYPAAKTMRDAMTQVASIRTVPTGDARTMNHAQTAVPAEAFSADAGENGSNRSGGIQVDPGLVGV